MGDQILQSVAVQQFTDRLHEQVVEVALLRIALEYGSVRHLTDAVIRSATCLSPVVAPTAAAEE